jgi:Alpha/beta hydrolase domain
MLPRMRSRFSVGSLLVLALTGPPLNARVIRVEMASRRSLAERYSKREDYLARHQKAVEDLVKQRWILQVDRTPLLHRAEQEWDEATK